MPENVETEDGIIETCSNSSMSECYVETSATVSKPEDIKTYVLFYFLKKVYN